MREGTCIYTGIERKVMEKDYTGKNGGARIKKEEKKIIVAHEEERNRKDKDRRGLGGKR